MVYVFIFLGEFGYELLNWQGVVRKFAGTIGSDDKIICCSRANLSPLYELADEFIDISAAPLFQQSRAFCYDAIYSAVRVGRWMVRSYGPEKWLRLRLRSSAMQKLLRIQLQRHVMAQSKLLRSMKLPGWLKAGIVTTDFKRCTFIFSSPATSLHGCTFGPGKVQNNIYYNLPVSNNIYRKIEADFSLRAGIEAQLGWSLSEPFVLVQERKRDASTAQPSVDTIQQDQLLERLASRIKTVLLSFKTGRWLDSYSSFAKVPNCFHYACRTFPEQACLIHFARHCLFFTEGDFGSHIYVPPFLGKDIIAVAPRSVYAIGTTPLDFWNLHVFQFGGQIVPKVAEEVFASPQAVGALLDELLLQQQLSPPVAEITGKRV
jgi:hypothetical protein